MIRFYLILTVFALTLQPACAQGYKADLKRMDAALAGAGEYVAAKENHLASLEKMLGSTDLSPEYRYELYEMLFKEYSTYKFENTITALDQMELLALQLKSETRIHDVELYKAEAYTTGGMFLEAQNLINNVIDTLKLSKAQKIRYFNIAQRFHGDYREYSDNMEKRAGLIDRQSYSRSRLFAELDSTDIEYRRVLMQTLMDEGNIDTAERVCEQVLAEISQNEHNFAVFAYYRALISQMQGNIEGAIHWYVESAVCDIRGAVKDNASLYSLARILLPLSEVQRAFKYTQVALDDALFYNARLRPFQIARSLPYIQNEYDRERGRQTQTARILTVIISVIAILLLASAIIAIRAGQRQRKAGAQIESMGIDLQAAVAELSEANAAKEEYLGLFLSMCSSYLDKLRKHISRAEIDEELKIFYNTFDNAFLHLYPDFVTDFNSLLKDEFRIELKKDELLNTELRIFALIRLGVTQSSHIASLLRYSVNTIYNYRAQIKKASILDPESFEERVKHL